MYDDREPSWKHELLVGLAVLVIIGALLGGALAVVAVKAVDYVGIGGSGGGTPEPILPTTGSVTQQPTHSSPTDSPTSPTTNEAPEHAIALSASPSRANAYQRVDLTGTYSGHDGAELQIQRRVGSGPWSDFPASTHVSGNGFATYIETGMTGVNHFRMVDKATGATSNIASVTIG